DFPSFLCELLHCEKARELSGRQAGSRRLAYCGLGDYEWDMSDLDSKPLSPALIAGVIFVLQIVGMAVMGVTGAMAKLPQAVQFFFGLEAVGFPLLVYVLLKRRENRGE
ncbi:MAG TPA: hypothetical protein VFG14_20505, partial [Chthoniobacteraceae bacterium]|nr:hypothetical protein [Chthoniobacteraceae bacterium]